MTAIRGKAVWIIGIAHLLHALVQLMHLATDLADRRLERQGQVEEQPNLTAYTARELAIGRRVLEAAQRLVCDPGSQWRFAAADETSLSRIKEFMEATRLWDAYEQGKEK